MYCPRTSNMINKLHERSLRIIMNDYSIDFNEFLESNNNMWNRYRNIQTLSIESFSNEKWTCFSNNVVNVKLVLVITCLWGKFGINCPSAFLKILKKSSISKFSKITRVIYLKNLPNQKYDYWLITLNQQAHWNCIETNIL